MIISLEILVLSCILIFLSFILSFFCFTLFNFSLIINFVLVPFFLFWFSVMFQYIYFDSSSFISKKKNEGLYRRKRKTNLGIKLRRRSALLVFYYKERPVQGERKYIYIFFLYFIFLILKKSKFLEGLRCSMVTVSYFLFFFEKSDQATKPKKDSWQFQKVYVCLKVCRK